MPSIQRTFSLHDRDACRVGAGVPQCNRSDKETIQHVSIHPCNALASLHDIPEAYWSIYLLPMMRLIRSKEETYFSGRKQPPAKSKIQNFSTSQLFFLCGEPTSRLLRTYSRLKNRQTSTRTRGFRQSARKLAT